MLHDCVSSFGDSGSPLLLIVDDQIYVAGFHVANGRAASNLLSVSLPVAVFDTASSELQTAEAPTGAGVVLLLMLLGLRVKEREGAAATAPPQGCRLTSRARHRRHPWRLPSLVDPKLEAK